MSTERSDQQTKGSISQALEDRTDERIAFVLEQTSKLYERLWRIIIQKRLPSHRRRGADVEDVIQEILKALFEALARSDCQFKSRTHIKYWSSKVAEYKAIDAFNGEDGPTPSSISPPHYQGEVLDPNETLSMLAGEKFPLEPTADCQLMEREIQQLIDELDACVRVKLAELNELSRVIIERWLDYQSYRTIAEDFCVTVYHVRMVTLGFKTAPLLESKTLALRTLIADTEHCCPGVTNRLRLSGPSNALLADVRQ
jgi:DNA-directed RNA polymerase specialized sigma24 family protein